MSGKTLIIPAALALNMNFTAKAIRLWLLLGAMARHKDDDGNLVNMCDRREIAEELNSSYQTVSNALYELQKAGWCRIDKIPGAYGRKVTIFETQQMPATKPRENEAKGLGEISGPAEI